MKRYLLFEYSTYYPSGGWNDLTGAYETLEQAMMQRASHPKGDNWQIVDLQDMTILYSN